MSPEATGPLRVGFVPGVTLTKWRTRWAERVRARLEVTEIAQADARDLLDAGELDMCFVRLPVDRTGLHAIPLYDETMVAWVGKEHPIAAFDEISTTDLADETVLDEPTQVAIDRVNAGAVLLVPMSVARSASRRDLVYRPVTDAESVTVALIWPTGADDPLIEEFIGIVRGRTANSSRTVRERAPQKPTRSRGRASGTGKPSTPRRRRGRR
ncbi:LysR substrate-binding domain-containing protein [Enemella sp. A6]|uniref:LysR substrate-binding domain-containing protein n=1 Tax=Enemella sp. A6 TaxID=3440152 RepID=UPI003EB9CC8D